MRLTPKQAQANTDMVVMELFYTNWLTPDNYDYFIWNQSVVEQAQNWDNDLKCLVDHQRWRQERAYALASAAAPPPPPHVVADEPLANDDPQA